MYIQGSTRRNLSSTKHLVESTWLRVHLAPSAWLVVIDASRFGILCYTSRFQHII
jgi:hypothetical protein